MTTTHSVRERAPGDTTTRRWLVLTLLATAQLMLVLDVTVVNVAGQLPRVRQCGCDRAKPSKVGALLSDDATITR